MPLALDANGSGEAVTVLLPVANVGESPHVNVTVDVAPLDVPVPLIVAVLPVTEVAGSVVTDGLVVRKD